MWSAWKSDMPSLIPGRVTSAQSFSSGFYDKYQYGIDVGNQMLTENNSIVRSSVLCSENGRTHFGGAVDI
jgi:hypothetical protein